MAKDKDEIERLIRLSEEEVERLIKFYTDAEQEILNEINRALLRGNKTEYLKAMQENVEVILADLRSGSRTWCEEAIPRTYIAGAESVDVQLKEQGAKVVVGFGAIHQQAAQVLAEHAHRRFEDVTSFIGRRSDDMYRTLALENIMGSVTGYKTWEQVAKSFREQLAAQGVTGFQDKANRNWNLRTYAEMVARTTTMEAHLEGTKRRLLENGHDLIKVSTHEGACSKCVPWQGKVLSLTGETEGYPTLDEAKEAGLFHPNCKHAFGLYIDLDAEIERLEAELGKGDEEQPNYLRLKDADMVDDTTKAIIDKELNMIPEAHQEILKSTVKEIVMVDKRNSGYDREKGIIYLLEGLTEGEVIHETAHAIETALDLYNNKKFLKVLADAVEGCTSQDIIFDPETFVAPVFRLKSPKFISEYQGVFRGDIYDDNQNINIKSLQEYFSEGYREYIINPKRLKSTDTALYNFIEELE